MEAKNKKEAEQIAVVAFADLELKGIVNDWYEIPVKKRVEVLINHTGPVPTQNPVGWIFRFEKRNGLWSLVNIREM